MTDILLDLSARRRADAEERAKTTPYEALLNEARNAPAPRGFAAALRRQGGVNIIAELKRASPSEGMIREDFRPCELAKDLTRAGAVALSVLCEPHRFLGGEDYLRRVRDVTDLPLLYKDFITTPYQVVAARAAGADAVLLIAAVLDDKRLAELLALARELKLDALVETHDETEIARAVRLGCDIIGVNCRNLRTFETDVSRLERFIALIPPHVVRVAESGMHDRAAIDAAHRAGADAFLVGTALMRHKNPGQKLQELTGKTNP